MEMEVIGVTEDQLEETSEKVFKALKETGLPIAW